MGEYTPNIKLYKPSIGETEWGDLVNNNFDVLDEQIDSIKKELITMAIKILMNQAVAHAISKDFYSIIADVITLDYPKGFKNTFESVSNPIEYEITIDNSNNPNDLTDYHILLEINDDEQFFEDCLYDQKLLEFYDEDKTTLLNHYVEEWDTENYNAKIWIKVPNIPANSTKRIYLKINVERTEDLSNPDAVFDFFDDFEGSELDTTKWTAYESVTVFNSELHIQGKASTYAPVVSKTTIKRPSSQSETSYIIEARGKFEESAQIDIIWYDGGDNVNLHGEHAYIKSDGLYWRHGTLSFSDTHALNVSLSANEYYKFALILTPLQVGVWLEGHDAVFYDNTDNMGARYIGLDAWSSSGNNDGWFDWVRVRKYTNPEPTITYTRNVIPVDYVTVTFDFPEGVDKLLVTTDSDAQNVYYSTDDGNTWNPIEQDTETELPETAYSIKLKFEQATYMRGYAFLTW